MLVLRPSDTSVMNARRAGGDEPPPLISAPSWGDVRDVYGYAQFLLNHHPEARALVDECRRRLALVPEAVRDRPWNEVVKWSQSSRLVLDYVGAVQPAARQLGLGVDRADAFHELAGREGYSLRTPFEARPPAPPSPAVASKFGADLTGDASWGSGATANRQARYRYVAGLEASRFEL